MMEKSIFMTLNDINVNDKTEMKNGLTYLSWAYCWAEVKKVVPDAQYTIYERDTEFGPVNYFTDGKTCWVKTGVTLNGLEHIEQLPVMDFKNKSIPLNAVTSTDVNKAIQRSLTKACARHGLGLYIYAGEDLPECERDQTEEQETAKAEQPKPEPYKPAFDVMPMIKAYCEQNELTGNEFTRLRNTCIEMGNLPRIPYNAMDEQQALKMLEIITLFRMSEEKSA
jgi:hypothetical protein